MAKLIRDLGKVQRGQAGLAELLWPDISFLDRDPPSRTRKAKLAPGPTASAPERRDPPEVPASETAAAGAHVSILDPEPEVERTADTGVAVPKPKRRLLTPMGAIPENCRGRKDEEVSHLVTLYVI
jgi:hypothetical protein